MDTRSEFGWDDIKAEGNLTKHGIPFNVAIGVFADPDHVVVTTVRVQDGESREKAIGTIAGRLVTVVFVMRSDVCRLISARRANAGEERSFGQG
ncbi:BrnT family toxin [Lichenihabitans sp. PAMC28606]|uniref:BrnT family toxin n=1 Tax=Lichenihabitans sp. PAMC28606 TaxID=2880932 RepID=UPI001D0B7A2D|nr:BrnT family toxin [Lichenihabitans sp. PAMC28606]UDL96013.1 BrnT family toxin [Lichenihabitans sp. PAMC28606]